MTTVQHPAFPTDVREVPDADAASWVEQGWLLADAPQFDNGEPLGYLPPGLTEVANDTGKPIEVTEAPKPGPRGKK